MVVCGNDGRVVCVYIVVESMHSFNKLFRGINFLEMKCELGLGGRILFETANVFRTKLRWELLTSR